MEFSILNEDILYYLLSKCSIISIMKLYVINKSFITDEIYKRIINNKWGINIGKEIDRSILDRNYLNFDKKLSIIFSNKTEDIYSKSISNSNIWATNRIMCLKYNNIPDKNKEVVIDELLTSYDKFYVNMNPLSSIIREKYPNQIENFKRLLGDSFDLNILTYVNIYEIYEILRSSITLGKMPIFKEKLKKNIIINFDSSYLSHQISLISRISSYDSILEKIDYKHVSLLNLNKNEMGLKYLSLLNNIFDNCVDDIYFKFKVYIAVQICKFMLLFKENLEKDHPMIEKMRAFNNLLGFKIIHIPEYLHFYATFEMTYILKNI
uniref:Uncharacterized protein n=1 Tax=viral metagenome TaxID=1070528 RepID=A0A6C0L9W6_9ZZZZ